MSLSKQLLTLLSLIFLIVFSVNFMLSMNNICAYLEGESEMHMQDTATSLGLSLSPHMKDENDPILQTMMNAIFDMGYYKEMRLLNVDGEELVYLSNPVRMEGVPRWLIKLLPMKTATAVSEINSGWHISGTLSVTANPAYAYMKLYQLVKESFIYSLLFFFAVFIVLILVLQLTLRSLKLIQKQASQISTGNFVISEPLPWTTEVRNVVLSMNSMSRKIGGIINHLNQRLDVLGDKIKRDPLTRLFNLTSFNQDLKQALSADQKGFVVYIKIDNLADISRDLGNQSADKLLKELAAVLNSEAENVTAYRLYGAEFALITSHKDIIAITVYAEQLKQSIAQIARHYGIDDLAHGGIVGFDFTSATEQLMPALIEAYNQAKLIGQNAFFIQQDMLKSMPEQEWKNIIQNTIDGNTTEITFTSQAFNYNTEPPQLVMQEALTLVRDGSGTPLSTGTFFSMAQKFNLAEALDRSVINKVIQLMALEHCATPIIINLSMASVTSVSFHAWLKARLQEISVETSLLTFSVTAYTAAKDLSAVISFSCFVKNLGARTLLKRYSSALIDITALKNLHIDYIRLDRELTENIRQNVGKSDFLETIKEVADLLDIKLLANAVIADEDFEFVKQKGLYGISR